MHFLKIWRISGYRLMIVLTDGCPPGILEPKGENKKGEPYGTPLFSIFSHALRHSLFLNVISFFFRGSDQLEDTAAHVVPKAFGLPLKNIF